jgi:hypothetical protein
MFALGRLVAGPAPAARTAFYNSGGLAKLQALLARAAGAGKRVKARAVNLISDLIGVRGSLEGRYVGWCATRRGARP